MSKIIINKVTSSQGFAWLGRSFSLFGKSAAIWIVMFILFVGINLLLGMIPFLELLPTILAPTFAVGFFVGCKELQANRMLQIDHLFAGFKNNFQMLFRLGLIYFGCNLIIFTLASLYVSQTVPEAALNLLAQAQTQPDMVAVLQSNPEIIPAILTAVFIALVLSIPLVMATWFAPALVYFKQLRPLQAMVLSVKACNKNLLPFLLYGLMFIPLLLLALLPLGLGMLVMLPVMLISQYISFQQVFSSDDDTDSEDGDSGVLTL